MPFNGVPISPPSMNAIERQQYDENDQGLVKNAATHLSSLSETWRHIWFCFNLPIKGIDNQYLVIRF